MGGYGPKLHLAAFPKSALCEMSQDCWREHEKGLPTAISCLVCAIAAVSPVLDAVGYHHTGQQRTARKRSGVCPISCAAWTASLLEEAWPDSLFWSGLCAAQAVQSRCTQAIAGSAKKFPGGTPQYGKAGQRQLLHQPSHTLTQGHGQGLGGTARDWWEWLSGSCFLLR